MRNWILFFALVMIISSCSIFKDSSKTKSKSTLDSSGTRISNFKSIDTGTVTNYERLTLYFQAGTFSLSNKNAPTGTSINDFASGLINATRDLASASLSLQDSTKQSPDKKAMVKPAKKVPGILNLPGLIAAAFESGSTEKKGITIEGNTNEKSDVHKKENLTETEEKSNPKLVVILSVLGYFSFAFVLIGLFLWYKSRK